MGVDQPRRDDLVRGIEYLTSLGTRDVLINTVDPPVPDSDVAHSREALRRNIAPGIRTDIEQEVTAFGDDIDEL